MNYGLPYKGSKNKIAEWVIEHLPEADNLYDVFAGGCAVTHCAIANDKYKNYTINDINGNVTEMFINAAQGKFKDCVKWVSHEEFMANRFNDPLVASMYSFGNNFRTYVYSRDIEQDKKIAHYAVVYHDFTPMKAKYPELAEKAMLSLFGIEGISRRREIFCKVCKEVYALRRIQHLERFERINSIDIHGVEIERLNTSYDKLTFKDNSVIFCDPPYINTNEYKKKLRDEKFNHEAFYDWCLSQTQPIFITEYYMPEDRFECIAEREKACSMNPFTNKKTIEKLFVPRT